MKSFLLFLLLTFSSVSNAVVQFNPATGFWVGNICVGISGVWNYLPIFQPIGSFCQILLPNGMVIQGQVVNM